LWLKVLNNNTHAIFTAATKAQTAADFLHGLQPQTLNRAMDVAAAPAYRRS
jgi:antirestriction protein ArdC